MNGVVGAEQVAQASASIVGLLPAILGQRDAVVGNGLVDLAVLWWGEARSATHLNMIIYYDTGPGTYPDGMGRGDLLLPSDWPCRMRMMRRGFAMVSLLPSEQVWQTEGQEKRWY